MWAVGAVQRQTAILLSRAKHEFPRKAASSGNPGKVLVYFRFEVLIFCRASLRAISPLSISRLSIAPLIAS